MKDRQLYRCLLLHILLPLLTGLAFYLFIRKEDSLFERWINWSTAITLELPSILTGVLPDFLWSYSLLSFLQLVWGSCKRVPALLQWLIYILAVYRTVHIPTQVKTCLYLPKRQGIPISFFSMIFPTVSKRSWQVAIITVIQAQYHQVANGSFSGDIKRMARRATFLWWMRKGEMLKQLTTGSTWNGCPAFGPDGYIFQFQCGVMHPKRDMIIMISGG